ncbi:hypothetical protein GMMP15_1440012 [Candidatus Magnetomoraceae bacterium gMMP-15]
MFLEKRNSKSEKCKLINEGCQKFYEIIIVNDGSDGLHTQRVMQEFKDKNYTVIEYPVNK